MPPGILPDNYSFMKGLTTDIGAGDGGLEAGRRDD
jgi:hypothetical protein